MARKNLRAPVKLSPTSLAGLFERIRRMLAMGVESWYGPHSLAAKRPVTNRLVW